MTFLLGREVNPINMGSKINGIFGIKVYFLIGGQLQSLYIYNIYTVYRKLLSENLGKMSTLRNTYVKSKVYI